MKNFYIFRHGETDMNKQGLVQGQKHNPPLNETGRSQAMAITPYLDGRNIEVIYASTLNRAFETASIVAEDLKIPVIPEKSFMECCFGDAEGMSREPASKIFKYVYTNWNDDNAGFPNGESKIELISRIVGKMREIATKTSHKNIGIATHGGIIRVLSLHFNFPIDDIPNGAILHIEYDKDFKVKGID